MNLILMLRIWPSMYVRVFLRIGVFVFVLLCVCIFLFFLVYGSVRERVSVCVFWTICVSMYAYVGKRTWTHNIRVHGHTNTHEDFMCVCGCKQACTCWVKAEKDSVCIRESAVCVRFCMYLNVCLI